MTSTPLPLARVAPSFVLCAALLLAAGCASDDDRPPRETGKQREHFPTMAGHETFFKGSLTAEVLVGAMTGFDLQGGPGGGGGGGDGLHGSGLRMKMGGGMHDGAPVGMGGGAPAMRPPDADGDVPGRQPALATRRADRLGSPPVMIHLRFINHGTEKADVVVADFLSPLGNFVVQPEKISLQPGEALAVEPMTSRLAGEISGGEVTLSLKLAGATETKTITLEVQPEPEAKPN